MTLVTLVATAGLVVLAVAQGLRRMPDRDQVLVRLVETAGDPEAHYQARIETPELPLYEPEILRSVFPRALSSWTVLRGWEKPQATRLKPHRFRRKAGPETPHATCPDQATLLARVVPVTAEQALKVEMTLRHRGAEAVHERDGLLAVLPLRSVPDLPSRLTEQSLREIWEADRCASKPKEPKPAFALGPARGTGDWESHVAAFRAPLDAQSLLFVFSCGWGDGELDVQRIGVRPVTLRHLTGLGALAEDDPPLMDHVADRTTAASFGIHLEKTSPPSIATVECLGETRDSFLLPAPARVDLDVDLPDGDAVLEFGLARHWERRFQWSRHLIRFSLTLEHRGVQEELLDLTLQPSDPSGWVDHTVDLRPWAGQRVRLSFESSSPRTNDLVVVGAPTIRRRVPGRRRPNVVLVSLDTMRADHMSAEGYPRPTTPHLDELARRNLWFRNARSPCSYTLPSHGSMLTGQLPSLHGAISREQGSSSRVSSRRSDLLAVRLREAGYVTAAFTGGNFLLPTFGFAEGFDSTLR